MAWVLIISEVWRPHAIVFFVSVDPWLHHSFIFRSHPFLYWLNSYSIQQIITAVSFCLKMMHSHQVCYILMIFILLKLFSSISILISMVNWIDRNPRSHSISLETNIEEVKVCNMLQFFSFFIFFIFNMKMMKKILSLLLLHGESSIFLGFDILFLLFVIGCKISFEPLKFLIVEDIQSAKWLDWGSWHPCRIESTRWLLSK